MKRWLMIAAMLAALAPATLGAQPRDWSRSAIATASGSWVIGNPAAKVKLVEYLSYTCPHCATFAGQSAAALKRDYLGKGRVSIEVRHAVFNGFDLTASLLARCDGPARFLGHSDAIFAAQDAWLTKGQKYAAANAPRLKTLPTSQVLVEFARGSGLGALMRARGMPPQKIAACLTNAAEQNALAAMAQAAQSAITATPSFAINGGRAEPAAWPGLKTRLDAALN